MIKGVFFFSSFLLWFKWICINKEVGLLLSRMNLTVPLLQRIKDKKLRQNMKQSETLAKKAKDAAARAEILLTTEPGYVLFPAYPLFFFWLAVSDLGISFIQTEAETEATWKVKQSDIKAAVGALAANKSFELNLDKYGPYTLDYTRNGRFMVLGGSKGHVALIDIVKSKSLCELNLKENVYDVQYVLLLPLLACYWSKMIKCQMIKVDYSTLNLLLVLRLN